MPGNKTNTAKRPKKNSALNYLLYGTLIGVLACAVALGCFIYSKETERAQKSAEQAKKAAEEAESAPPTTIINDSIKETVRVAASKGWKPCPNKDCLTLAKPPWSHKNAPGHDPSDYWHEFTYTGGRGAFNQCHIGHIIKEHSDRNPEDQGACPVCHGTGWVRKDFKY